MWATMPILLKGETFMMIKIVFFLSLTLVDQEIMKDDKTMIEQDDKKDNNDCGQ